MIGMDGAQVAWMHCTSLASEEIPSQNTSAKVYSDEKDLIKPLFSARLSRLEISRGSKSQKEFARLDKRVEEGARALPTKYRHIAFFFSFFFVFITPLDYNTMFESLKKTKTAEPEEGLPEGKEDASHLERLDTVNTVASRPDRIRNHFVKFWVWYTLASVIFLAIFLPIL